MIDVISKIADLQPDPKPNPDAGVGRECYAFSDTEDQAFEMLANEAEWLFINNEIDASAFNIEVDAIGNLFITLYGKNRQEIVMSGSHVDSVYKGGMYDGVAGVHSAFHFLEALIKQKKTPERSYTVAVFRSEEASPKTGNTCIGSRVATGTLKEKDLLNINYKLDDGSLMPFRDFFIMKYGEHRWNAVLDELKNPPLIKNRIVAYEELHIEQSAVTDLNKADLGVVIDGIGGAIRETVHIPLNPQYLKEIDVTPQNPHTHFKLLFLGEEAHTGGTPHNPTFQRADENALWYRKDALIGASRFMNALFLTNFFKNVKILKFSVPQEVGFTTVPKEQNIEMLVPKELQDDFEIFVLEMSEIIEQQFGVRVEAGRNDFVRGKFEYFDSRVFDALDIPVVVESRVREKCNEQIEAYGGGVGKVRGTVTDMKFGAEVSKPSVRCNLDFRDVDPESIDEIRKTVHARILELAKDLIPPENFSEEAFHVVKTVSKKPYALVDARGIEDKVRIAQEKGFKVMKMPSLPGHDAASLSYIGVPVSMTFVRHDGRSHTGFETMPDEHYQKAEAVSHQFLAEKLGLS